MPHVQVIWNVMALINFPCLVNSVYPITIARDEFSTKLTISFPKGGMHILIACGIIINFIVCRYVRPILLPASICPEGIAAIAPLNVSHWYAPELNASAHIALRYILSLKISANIGIPSTNSAVDSSISLPIWMPKCKNRNWTISGVFLNISVYIVAIEFRGLNFQGLIFILLFFFVEESFLS